MPLVVVAVLFFSLVGFFQGRHMVEKMLTKLVMPVGFIWLLLTLTTYCSIISRNRSTAFFSFAAWIGLSFFGMSFVADQLVSSIEKPYVSSRPLEGDDFDVIVVLGGGTSYSKNETPQLGNSGDRVMLAARMYQLGKTKKLVCTGKNIAATSFDDVPDVSVQTRQIFVDLGIPAEDIESIGGRNTFEEMQTLEKKFREQGDVKVGVITSAWHLSRAMRLAEAAGLDAEPIPADFRTPNSPTTLLKFIPSSVALENSARVCKEWLAGLMGR